MKIAKFFAGIFGAIGTILLIGSIGLCLFSLKAPVRMEQIPSGALKCADVFENAISGKDYDALEGCIYGQPNLGLSGQPEDALSRMVWDLLQQNLEFSWQGECYHSNGVLRRDAMVRYLEAASITGNLQTRAHALLTMRVEEAEDMAQLYDDGGAFREDLLDQVMQSAVTQACMEDVTSAEIAVTVEFVHRDGQWWAVPDAAVLTALSGGLA